MMTLAEELRVVLPRTIAPNHELLVQEPTDCRDALVGMFRAFGFQDDARITEWLGTDTNTAETVANKFLKKFLPDKESLAYIRKTDGKIRYIILVTREVAGSNYEMRVALAIGGRDASIGPVLYRALWDIGARRILSGYQSGQGRGTLQYLTGMGFKEKARASSGDYDIVWEMKTRP